MIMDAGDLRITRADSQFSAWDELLELILRAFNSMHGRIDPPSSALLLSPEALRQKAATETAFLAHAGDRLAGCMFLSDRGDHLYLGKLAVEPAMQGRGIGRRLIFEAERFARDMGKLFIELQTRVELTENHRAFSRLGFVETVRTSHPGYVRPTTIAMRKVLA